MSTKILFRRNTRPGLGGWLNALCAKRSQWLAEHFAASTSTKMAVFAHDHIGIQINHFGVYEGEQLEMLFAFMEPLRAEFAAGTALDIGANIGNHALFFADRFSQVHAMEPNPTVFQLLSFNAGQVENITVHNFGLGDAAGSFDLEEVAGNLGASSVKPQRDPSIRERAVAKTVRIELRTLNDMADAFADVCFIKIDVEGFEPNVLRGGLAFLKRQQPLIVLEQDKREFKNGTTPAIEILEQLGYRFCWLHAAGLTSRRKLTRRLSRLVESFVGRRFKIVAGETVPPNTYNMLVAVPPRLGHLLELG